MSLGGATVPVLTGVLGPCHLHGRRGPGEHRPFHGGCWSRLGPRLMGPWELLSGHSLQRTQHSPDIQAGQRTSIRSCPKECLVALRAPNTSPASQWFGRSCGSCSLTDCETGLRMNGGEGPRRSPGSWEGRRPAGQPGPGSAPSPALP